MLTYAQESPHSHSTLPTNEVQSLNLPFSLLRYWLETGCDCVRCGSELAGSQLTAVCCNTVPCVVLWNGVSVLRLCAVRCGTL